MTQRDFYLDLYAKGIGGPDTHVADPPTFAHFLLQKASEFDNAVVHGAQGLRHLWQVDPSAPSGSPLTIADQQAPTTFRGALETPAFQSYLPSAATRQLPETIARPLVENLTSPLGIAGGASAPARALGSVALGLLAEEAARRANAPPAVQTIAGLGGGVLGGAPGIVPATGRFALRGAQIAGRGGARLAEEVGKTNVGNVLLPRAQATVVKPLIYENLHPVERQLYGIESKGRLTQDEVEDARDYLYGPADPATGRRPGGLVSSEDTAQIQNFEERYRGKHQLANRRREVAEVLVKYLGPETPKPTGSIAQAGFSGGMGPGQVARGTAEQARMTQAPLSEVAASEADRIAQGRQLAHATTEGVTPEIQEQYISFAPYKEMLTSIGSRFSRFDELDLIKQARVEIRDKLERETKIFRGAKRRFDGPGSESGDIINPDTGQLEGNVYQSATRRAAQMVETYRTALNNLDERQTFLENQAAASQVAHAATGAGSAVGGIEPAEAALLRKFDATAGRGGRTQLSEAEQMTLRRLIERHGVADPNIGAINKQFGGEVQIYLGAVDAETLGRPAWMGREFLVWNPQTGEFGIHSTVPDPRTVAALRRDLAIGRVVPPGPGAQRTLEIFGLPEDAIGGRPQLPSVPISQEPAAGPRPSASPLFAPTGAVSQVTVSSPPVATSPRSVLVTPPPAQPPVPPPPPTVPPAGAVPPVPPAGVPPVPPAGPVLPSGIDPDPFRLGNITPGLDPWDTLLNRVKQQFQDVTGARGSLLVRKDPNVNPAFDQRARIIRVGASHAVNVESAVQTALRDAKFVFDKEGRIPSLANAEFPQGPALADLAAKLPNFTLNPEQTAAMQSIRDNLAPFKAALDKTGVEYGTRPDIIPGGFYFPRVSDLPPEQLAQVRIRGVRGGRGGFEKTATQPTQAAGIEAGIGYLPPADAVRLHINEVARRVADAQTANYLKPFGVSAQTPPRGMSSIALSPLQGTAFPNAMADAANKVLAEEGRLSGKGSGTINAANAVNDLMQATSTTLDNSAAGIQGLVGLGADPGAFGRALVINVRAWRDPEVLSRYIASHDPQALQRGTLTASQKASLGLHLSGSNPAELTVRGRIGQLPGISAANRAFTALGDALRLSWSDDILYEELQRGRTMQEIIASGDAERVMRIANRMTGTADVGFMQQFLPRPLLFASRFLQARIETVGQGIAGLRSLSLTDIPLYPAKYDVTVGFKVPIDQRIARQSLLRLIGGAALLTVAANEAQGRDTDFRPIVNGRFNGNFMRLRLGNRDFSLLGTWDSLFRAGATIGTGHPLEAARSLSSPLVSLAWDIGSGTNAIGKSITTWPQRALRVGQAVAPLGLAQAPQAVQEAIQGAQQGSNTVAAGGAVGAAAELTGFKSAPLSFTDIANDISQQNYGVKWDQLDPNTVQGKQRRKFVSDRVTQLRPDIALASIQKTFSTYGSMDNEQRNFLKSDLKNLIRLSRDAGVTAKARAMLQELEDFERGRSGSPLLNPSGLYQAPAR